MSGPLDALKKATGIGPNPNPPGRPEDDWLGTAIQGLLGVGGLGDPESQANRGGAALGAAIPVVGGLGSAIRQGPHPAISALLKLLGKTPEAPSAERQFLGEKLSGWVPHRPAIEAPEGFELGGTSEFMGRDPGLVEKYVAEQGRRLDPHLQDAPQPATSRYGDRTMRSSPYGVGPGRSQVTPKPRANLNEKPAGFESKFGLSSEEEKEFRRVGGYRNTRKIK